jgi:hypothetical protein
MGYKDFEVNDVYDDLENESHWDADVTVNRAMNGQFKPVGPLEPCPASPDPTCLCASTCRPFITTRPCVTF